MAAYPVWSVLAAQSVVKVDVVVVVACAGCGSSVASGRLRGVGLVEAHLGCRCELFVGEWRDVFGPRRLTRARGGQAQGLTRSTRAPAGKAPPARNS